MKNFIMHALFGICLVAGNLGTAHAALVYVFSDLSSDSTPASVLDATLSFSISSLGSNSGNDLLTLTLDNQTSLPDIYNINELYFNFSGNHGAFSLESGDGTLNHGPSAAAGFGNFDIRLDGFILGSPESLTWEIDLGLTGITETYFNDLSSIPPGNQQALAALKFVQGPGDDSAFAAVVPVPAAAWLFVSGLVALITLVRKNKI